MNKELDKMCKQFEQDLKSEKIRYATQEEVEQYNNNEEIKLILTKLKLVSEIEENGAYICDKEHSKILLDCITNLQEENKEWSMIFDTFSKRPYAHKYLEEKKKELGNKKIIGLDSEMIYKDYYDYKSRNEKAIEYIKNKQELNKMFGTITLSKDSQNELLNILGGDDNAINSK